MMPVGGFTTRVSSAFAAAPRGIHAWRDNSDATQIAAGTYNKLYYVNASGTVSDITPTSFTAGNENASVNTAYGGGFYNNGLYGVTRPYSGVFQEATTWSLDNWGEYLVGCTPDDGKLYEWQLNTSVVAAQISNAPVNNLGLIVTAERFLFALGAGDNPRKVQWCDKENNTVWTPAATNEAGDFELQTSGQIMGAVRVRNGTLIVTDTDAHLARYIGPPFVFGFERVGTACGAISRKAIASVDSGAFWMGKNGFFVFDGSVAKEINCDVSDYVFENINQNQITQTYAVHNSQFSEIWWFFPSGDSKENNKYVAFDYKENHWEIGEINRSCGFDIGVYDNPIWADDSGNLYDQELDPQVGHGSLSVFAESGPVSLGAGDNVMKVTNLIPDEKTQGDVKVTFKTRFYPNDSETSFGPFTTANPTDVRFTGRQVRIRIDGERNTSWRAGTMRIEAKPGGNR